MACSFSPFSENSIPTPFILILKSKDCFVRIALMLISYHVLYIVRFVFICFGEHYIALYGFVCQCHWNTCSTRNTCMYLFLAGESLVSVSVSVILFPFCRLMGACRSLRRRSKTNCCILILMVCTYNYVLLLWLMSVFIFVTVWQMTISFFLATSPTARKWSKIFLTLNEIMIAFVMTGNTACLPCNFELDHEKFFYYLHSFALMACRATVMPCFMQLTLVIRPSLFSFFFAGSQSLTLISGWHALPQFPCLCLPTLSVLILAHCITKIHLCPSGSQNHSSKVIT